MKQATSAAIQKAIKAYQARITHALTEQAVKAHIAGNIKAYSQLKPLAIDFNLVQQEAKRYGAEYAKMLTNEGASIINGEKIAWLADSSKRTRAEVADIINNGLKQGKPVAQIGGKKLAKGTIAYDLKQTLIRDKDYEYVRIARTEVARIQSEASLERYKANGVQKVKWLCGGNPCKICAEYCNKIYSIGELPSIPVHPNCTCDKAPQIDRKQREQIASTPQTTKQDKYYYNGDIKAMNAKLWKYDSRIPNSKVALTEAEEMGRDVYRGTGYYPINNYLRGKTPATSSTKQFISSLDSAIAKSKLPNDMTVFRGISDKQAAQLLKTNVYKEPAFMSTSYDPLKALDFAAPDKSDYMNMITFQVKKGTNALIFPGGENEILLARGAKLKCTAIKEFDNFFPIAGKTDVPAGKVRMFVMEMGK